MKKIRTKIIFIFLATVLLPVIPLSVLVYNLINQSYHVGVNPGVKQALEEGLRFSKMAYDLHRRQLSDALQTFSRSLAPAFRRPGTTGEAVLEHLPLDTLVWKPLRLSLIDREGNRIWQYDFQPEGSQPIDPVLRNQLNNPQRERLIVSRRKENLFTAIQRLPDSQGHVQYLFLQVRMNPALLAAADQVLQTNQMYQALDLTHHSLPSHFLFAFVALTLILLSLIVLVAIWISSRITAPLTLLVEGTREIGKGNLDYRIPALRREDEVAQLVTYFNLMADQLKENQERLIYLEKMAAWQQMARKLAHEIKNPLTPIQLSIQQLVDKYSPASPEYSQLLAECAGIINEEIGSLRRLVSEFSEFGRLPELQLVKGDVNRLLRELKHLYSEKLVLELDERLPELYFDPDRVRRALINLIENGLQADPAGRPVIVTTYSENHKVCIRVKDFGTGIPEALRSKIFEPSFSTKKEGMGLGLAITRLIVEEHGGKIQVDSRVGEGTSFTIKFPAAGAENSEKREPV